jgi:peptidyl-prolyl cis-trans isomerase SurA
MKPPKSLLLLAASLSGLASPLRAEVLDRIIAKVNGEMITLTEFQARQVGALKQAQIPATRQEAYLREHSRELLDQAIDELLIAQAAEEGAKDVPEDYLKQVLESIKKDYKIDSDEEFERRIRSEGLTLDDVKRDIRRSIVTRRYIGEEVERKLVVTDGELRAEYEARKSTDFGATPSERLAEVLVPSKEQAAQVAARLRAGEDFAAVAREVSSAPSRTSGGDLGTIPRRSMNASLLEVVANLGPGQVSDPIPAKGGYRILKVVSRDNGRQQSYEEVAEKLRAELRERRRAEALDALSKRLREHADIEEMVREVPLQVQLNPEEAPAQPSIGAAAAGAGQAGDGADEFRSSQGKVRRVTPAAPAAEPAATPTPAP